MIKLIKTQTRKNIIINIIMISIFLSYYSCKKQENSNSLPINKLYIVEYNYIINSDNDKTIFLVYGFSELDKYFKLKNAIYGNNGIYYYNSEIHIPDSLKNKISRILLNYRTDTFFVSPKKYRIYDGNYYRFFIQKNDKEEISIKFEPEFLPNDLLFLYKYLYGNRKDSLSKYNFDELFKEFEKKLQSDMPLPLIVKDTLFIKK